MTKPAMVNGVNTISRKYLVQRDRKSEGEKEGISVTDAYSVIYPTIRPSIGIVHVY